MNVNATMFVQMIHFLVAYYVIYRILLKPSVAIIVAERDAIHALEEVVVQEEHNCIHKQDLQQEQWNNFQQAWRSQAPLPLDWQDRELRGLEVHSVDITDDFVKKSVREIVPEIKRRVEYGS